MKYRIVEPRMLMVSRETGSRPRWVILTVRKAVFICGETEAMVPLIIVPIDVISVMSRGRTKVIDIDTDAYRS